jgi:hypothetical protein
MLFEARKTGIPEDVVKAVVARTLRSKVEEINHTLAEIQHSITYFERKYGMKTEEFYDKFIRGEAGDDMDFFEWKAAKELSDELEAERKVLLEIL